MSRIRAKALVLVNWRGVFYERYILDSHVTALEGANGAGKTTVLIGCYVVLLPDMTRLRFANLSEHAPSGGDRGLWGRLGESSRPAYAVLELGMERGERLLAGVHLQRKAEPTVELTPFIITGLSASARLQDILLERGEMDSIPELAQLRDQVASQGAVLQVFSTAKDYFATLFDRGITPLRLASDNDRNKLNEMLRTSMAGGISRALTSELREFLLKEEAGLADTLKRMRANLDACRRTRIEVEESRKLEQEITGVYDAGQQMFAAAIHATRERAEELHRRFEEASSAWRDADNAEQMLRRELDTAKGEWQRIEPQLSEAQQLLTEARDFLSRLRRALVIARRIQERQQALLSGQQEHAEAKNAVLLADASQLRARHERDDSQSNLVAAASSLADLQKGLEELHRRAAEHRLAMRHLDHARQALPDEHVDADSAATVLANVEGRYEVTSKENNQLTNMVRNAEQHQKDFGIVLDALQKITGDVIGPEEAFSRAQRVATELRDLDARAAQREPLDNKILETRRLAGQQKQARTLAAELTTSEEAIETSESVRTILERLETDIESESERLRDEQSGATAAARQRAGLEGDIQQLERDVVTWREVLGRVEPLEQRYCTPLRSREALRALCSRLNRERDQCRDQLTQLQADHDHVVEEAVQIEQSGGTFHSSLLRARDLVDGELLAGQFEELTIEDARKVEALLGPLSEAIVVDDPSAAAHALCDLGDIPGSVWLVGGDAMPTMDVDGRPQGEVADGHAIVSGQTEWRVSRIPDKPTLGRRARARRVAELREQAKGCAEEIEQLESMLRDVVGTISTIDRLLSEADALECGDPSDELARTRSSVEAVQVKENAHRDAAAQLSDRMDSMKLRRNALRDLLPLAWLLDEPDHEQCLDDLEQALHEAKKAAQKLQHIAQPRSVVEARMDELRTPPIATDELAGMQRRIDSLKIQQEELIKAIDALRYVDEHRVALTWSDAADALNRKIALEPAVQRQLDKARELAEQTQNALNAAEEALAEANQWFNRADANVQQLVAALERDNEEWQACQVESATDEDIRRAERAVQEADARDRQVKEHSREISERMVRLDERLASAIENLEKRRGERDEAERSWLPNQERWKRLEALAAERGVLASAMTRRFIDAFSGRGSPNVRIETQKAATSLRERLTHARDSSDVLTSVKDLLGSQELSGESCLLTWLAVRDWLRRRIPAQIADVAEPIEALDRLRNHLVGLEERLARQETALRGESSDVARNIDIHIRRAQRQVSHLNHDLGDVRFGSIHGVRLKLERVERMGQVLDALRDGEGQSLLFQPDMPIENALDELFRRYGSGGRTTGQRLLDYREYVEPKVEIRRQANEQWEVANPMRMSTGEAIGVGAALMMVVLTAWERDANLLRPKRSYGTLRLLFLDEANRLSQDNLSVLFDLCQSLDLQLIIAAPEVAQAEGNTTYRLVRRVDESGREGVIVTGRRLAVERHA